MTTVHPDVWSDALRQAGGDASRIEVLSETSVVVHNRSDWRQHRRGPSPLHRVPPTAPSPAVLDSSAPAVPDSSAPAVPDTSASPAPIAAVPDTSDTPDQEPATETPAPAGTSPVPQPTFLHSAPPTEPLANDNETDDDKSSQPKAPVIPIAAFVAPQLRAADSDS